MEIVEGETLAARLKKGKHSDRETLKYGAQIADALAAEHAKTSTEISNPATLLTGSSVKVPDWSRNCGR